MKFSFLLLVFTTALAGQAGRGTLTIPPDQQFQGTVVDAVTGIPIEGAFVSAPGSQSAVVRTGTSGRFQLQTSTTNLQAATPGYLTNYNILLQPGQDSTIRLSPAATISGKIEDQDGFPAAEAQVQVLRYQQANLERRLVSRASAQSNDLGEYRISGLSSGRYYLRISGGSAPNWDSRYVTQFAGGTLEPVEAGAVEVAAGQQRTGVTLRLARFEGVTVSGRVEGAPASPSRQVIVSLRPPDNGWSSTFLVANTGASGAFTFRHVPPGHYTVRAELNTGNSGRQAGDLLGEVRIDVDTVTVRDLAITLQAVQPIDILGIVEMAGGASLTPVAISARGQYGPSITASSSKDGSFVLKGLLPGHYDLQMMPNSLFVAQSSASGQWRPPALPAAAHLGGVDVLNKGFDVDGRPLGPIHVTLATAPNVTGTALDATGKPLANRLVYFVSQSASGAATSKSDGVFQLFLRRTGEYRVYVLPDTSAATDPDFFAAHEKDFIPVKVVSGDNLPITIRWPAR